MIFTTTEAEQYVRMTLKQWGLSDVSFEWWESEKNRGWAWAEESHIALATNILSSFACFRETLLHEMAHILDHRERGTYVVNVREMAHGKNFRKWCKVLGIPARLKIPL